MRYQAKHAAFATAALAAAALLLGGCASTNTSGSADNSVDFHQYQTYAFMEDLQTDKAAYQSIESTYLKDAVAKQMAARGFVKSDNPDIVINFAIESKEKVRSRPAPGVGYYADPYYDYGYAVGYGYGGSYIDQYTEGHLKIFAVDVAAKRVVWEGRAQGRITKKDEADWNATLTNAVNEVFAHFPVPAPVPEQVSYRVQ